MVLPTSNVSVWTRLPLWLFCFHPIVEFIPVNLRADKLYLNGNLCLSLGQIRRDRKITIPPIIAQVSTRR